jgi:hypothetical protein
MRILKTVLVALVAMLSGVAVQAQTSASNLVSLMEDNIVNAETVIGPLALGLLLLAIGVGAALYLWRLKRGGR